VIVVDSSVWIDYLRGKATPQVENLDTLIGQRSLIVGDVILCEVVLGVSSEREAQTGECSAPFRSRANARRRAGAPGGSALSDPARQRHHDTQDDRLIIGAWCIAHGAKLLHNDRDFALLERHAGLLPA